MKRITFLFIYIFILCCGFANANIQRPNGKHEFSPEKFRKEMESFIAHEACLTPQEQQTFFPVLNEMMEAQRKLKAQEHELMMSGKNAKTEDDYEKILKQIQSIHYQNTKLEQAYLPKFKKILPWEKIYKVRLAVFKFSMRALRDFSPRKKTPQQ